MKGNNEDFQNKIKDLENILLTDTKKEITDNELKLVLYNLLRECLIRRKYVFQVGAYKIDLTPQKLGVIYETDSTYIEVSNEDLYQQTERDTEARFFVVDKNRNKEDFDATITKAIRTEGVVLNTNGVFEEIYHLELFSQFETDDIMNYISVDPNYVEVESPTSIYIKRKINRDDPRTDTIDFLAGEIIIPVTYYERENKYVPNKELRKTYEPNNYSLLIPDNSSIVRIAKMIYACMIDFYTEYAQEHQ